MSEKRLSLGINVSILLILMIFGALLSLPLRLLFDTSYYDRQRNGDENNVTDPNDPKGESVFMIPVDHRKLRRCPNLRYEDRLESVFLSDYDGNCTYARRDDEDDDDDDDYDDDDDGINDDDDDDDDDDDEDNSEKKKYSRKNRRSRGRSSNELAKENAEEILRTRQTKSIAVASHILVAMLLISVIAALIEVLRIRFARDKVLHYVL